MTTPPTTELPTLASQPDTTPPGLPVMLLSTGPSDSQGMVVKVEFTCPDFARGEQLVRMLMAAPAPTVTPAHVPRGLLKKEEAAKLLAISPRTLDRLIADDRSKIPCIKIYGCRVFDPDTLKEWALGMIKRGGLK